MASSNLALPEHQRRKEPASLYRFIHMCRKVGYTGRTARKSIQCVGEVFCNPSWLQFEFLNNLMEIRILELQDLMEPVNDFNVGISPQFAKRRSAFDGFETDCIELSKQLRTTNLRHS